MNTMSIFILQKQNNGIANANFENFKVFSSNIKALTFCRKQLNLEPLNVKTKSDFEKFINSDEQLLGLKEKIGVNVNRIVIRYRIVKMEIEN